MKLRSILLGVTSLLLVALLFYACRKELQESISISDSSLTIVEAKQFFETNVLTQKSGTIERHGFSRRFLSKKNRWGKAFVKKLSIGNAVVVPLHFPKELYLYRKHGRIHLPLSDLSWMLFYRDSLHRIHAEVVTYLPDNAYFQDTAHDKRFSGVVTISDWKGNFLKGFQYDSKGIKKVISQEEIKIKSTMRGTLNGAVMLSAPAAPVICTATDWYTCVSDDGGNTFDCHYDYTEYDCTGGSGGGGGGIDDGGYPSGGDYGSLPPKLIGGGGSSSGGNQGGGNDTNDKPTLIDIFKFPPGSDYEHKYPKFTKLVKEIRADALKNTKVLYGITYYTKLSEAKVKEALTWGKGPTIVIKDINSGQFFHRYGYYSHKDNPNTIFIDIATVHDYEMGNKKSLEAALQLLITVTVLHEYVHLAGWQTGAEPSKYELGDGFEIYAYGGTIGGVNDALEYLDLRDKK